MEDGQKLENQNVAPVSDFPKPPEADIEIRTMESDFKTLKMSGGDLESIQLRGIASSGICRSGKSDFFSSECCWRKFIANIAV